MMNIIPSAAFLFFPSLEFNKAKYAVCHFIKKLQNKKTSVLKTFPYQETWLNIEPLPVSPVITTPPFLLLRSCLLLMVYSGHEEI